MRFERKYEEFRQELLDLSMRNSLLNYRPSKARGVHVKGESGKEVYDPDEATSFANIIKYKNGEWDDLPVVRDIWGRPAKNTPEGKDPFTHHLFDLRKPKKTTDAAKVRLMHLYDATGDTDVIPSWPSPTVKLPNGNKLTLNPQLFDSYVEQLQGAKLQAFAELTGDQRWYRVAEQDAVDMLKKRMDNYAGKARMRWIYQNAPALIEQDKKLQQQQQGR